MNIPQSAIQQVYDTLTNCSNSTFAHIESSSFCPTLSEYFKGKSEGMSEAAKLLADISKINGAPLDTKDSDFDLHKSHSEDVRAEYSEQQRREDAEYEEVEVEYF